MAVVVVVASGGMLFAEEKTAKGTPASKIEMLEKTKANNQETIQKQERLLQNLEALKSETEQIRILASRS